MSGAFTIEQPFLAMLVMMISGAVMATEEPVYTVAAQSGAIEMRRYAPMVVAETFVTGSMREASGRGFRVIADYIFGNNTAAEGGSQKISMTAPVSMQESGGKWRVHFVMPSEFRLADLPRPNNPDVTLREIPATDYAVVRFSGLSGADKVTAKTAELLAWLEARDIDPVGNPLLARYNPPWTLPFLRRNEVMIRYR